MFELIQGDCLELMRAMPANSVDLIATDPPYFKVKGDAWDNQWATPAAFLAWFDLLAEQWQRILRPNGSLYVFAWPAMAARVEVLIGERFNVLNTITWGKDAGWHKRAAKDELRSFFPASERIIFAEHKGADIPIRAYLAAERDRAGFTTRKVAEAFQVKSGSRTVTGMAGHWFNAVQWELPTAANYAWLRGLFGPGFLRREYEDLRRPFNVSADVPYTDVWDKYPTVMRRGKHPCEKPEAMMADIIRASSRPGAVVLDCFMGSGVTGEAAVRLGREFIGMEADVGHFGDASTRIRAALPENPATTRTEQPMAPHISHHAIPRRPLAPAQMGLSWWAFATLTPGDDPRSAAIRETARRELAELEDAIRGIGKLAPLAGEKLLEVARVEVEVARTAKMDHAYIDLGVDPMEGGRDGGPAVRAALETLRAAGYTVDLDGRSGQVMIEVDAALRPVIRQALHATDAACVWLVGRFYEAPK